MGSPHRKDSCHRELLRLSPSDPARGPSPYTTPQDPGGASTQNPPRSRCSILQPHSGLLRRPPPPAKQPNLLICQGPAKPGRGAVCLRSPKAHIPLPLKVQDPQELTISSGETGHRESPAEWPVAEHHPVQGRLRLDSRSGHTPRLQVPSVQKATGRCFSLSLSPSL